MPFEDEVPKQSSSPYPQWAAGTANTVTNLVRQGKKSPEIVDYVAVARNELAVQMGHTEIVLGVLRISAQLEWATTIKNYLFQWN